MDTFLPILILLALPVAWILIGISWYLQVRRLWRPTWQYWTLDVEEDCDEGSNEPSHKCK